MSWIKKLFRSWTINFNLLVPAVAAVAVALGHPIPEEVVTAALVVGNFLLRLKTKEPISAKGEKKKPAGNSVVVPCILFAVLLSFAGPARADDVTLAWNASVSGDVVGYRIFQHPDGESYDYNNPDWEGPGLTGSVTSPLVDTVYYYVARAFDGAGNESVNSNEVTYRTKPDTTPPEAPRNLRVNP